MSNHHYTVVLPVKPYVRKYVAAIEGDTIHFNSDSMLCLIIRAYLQNSNRCGLSKQQIQTNLLTRTSEIKILIPATPKNKSTIGFELKGDHIVLINRFLEDCFERALLHYIKMHTKREGRFKGYKEAFYGFAELYNIVLEEDISYDGLKKIEHRSRCSSADAEKKIDKNIFTLVPSSEKLVA